MRRKINIPSEVRESIFEHFREAINKAVEAYESANEEEDALTGQLGICLKCTSKSVMVNSNQEKEQRAGVWKWSFNYYKFRGRGPKPTENILGADGIFEFGIQYGDRFQKKSVLFQSKNDLKTDRELFNQSLKLSTWREAAFVLNFTPDKIESFYLDDVIKSNGTRRNIVNSFELYDFLCNVFLECLIGDMDLEYDGRTHRLTWLTQSNNKVNTKFAVKNRFSLKVVPPKYKDDSYGAEIPNSEVHNHRMKFSPEDLFLLEYTFTKKELTKARNKYAQIYHSDVNNDLDELMKHIQKRRMQEGNYAYEELKHKARK